MRRNRCCSRSLEAASFLATTIPDALEDGQNTDLRRLFSKEVRRHLGRERSVEEAGGTRSSPDPPMIPGRSCRVRVSDRLFNGLSKVLAPQLFRL
jgi:hypothetical protein